MLHRYLSNDHVGVGIEGHRVSGDTAGSWFQNRRFRSREVGGATVEQLITRPSMNLWLTALSALLNPPQPV